MIIKERAVVELPRNRDYLSVTIRNKMPNFGQFSNKGDEEGKRFEDALLAIPRVEEASCYKGYEVSIRKAASYTSAEVSEGVIAKLMELNGVDRREVIVQVIDHINGVDGYDLSAIKEVEREWEELISSQEDA